jgi:hypothetical protein
MNFGSFSNFININLNPGGLTTVFQRGCGSGQFTSGSRSTTGSSRQKKANGAAAGSPRFGKKEDRFMGLAFFSDWIQFSATLVRKASPSNQSFEQKCDYIRHPDGNKAQNE